MDWYLVEEKRLVTRTVGGTASNVIGKERCTFKDRYATQPKRCADILDQSIGMRVSVSELAAVRHRNATYRTKATAKTHVRTDRLPRIGTAKGLLPFAALKFISLRSCIFLSKVQICESRVPLGWKSWRCRQRHCSFKRKLHNTADFTSSNPTPPP